LIMLPGDSGGGGVQEPIHFDILIIHGNLQKLHLKPTRLRDAGYLMLDT
jgi:hypothetical protein